MTNPVIDEKATLQRYLDIARDALLYKLEGLSEYDQRRPLTPTGTNLLGLIKHVASVEAGYFGETFGRPFSDDLPWLQDDAADNADMWATADESTQSVLDFFARVRTFADQTIATQDLDASGTVAWWPASRNPVTLHQVLVHVIADINRHAGHADIVRELIDGSAGLRADNSNLPSGDAAWWSDYRDELERTARTFR